MIGNPPKVVPLTNAQRVYLRGICEEMAATDGEDAMLADEILRGVPDSLFQWQRAAIIKWMTKIVSEAGGDAEMASSILAVVTLETGEPTVEGRITIEDREGTVLTRGGRMSDVWAMVMGDDPEFDDVKDPFQALGWIWKAPDFELKGDMERVRRVASLASVGIMRLCVNVLRMCGDDITNLDAEIWKSQAEDEGSMSEQCPRCPAMWGGGLSDQREDCADIDCPYTTVAS